MVETRPCQKGPLLVNQGVHVICAREIVKQMMIAVDVFSASSDLTIHEYQDAMGLVLLERIIVLSIQSL